MNLKELSHPLSIETVDFRVQSINKGGYATILAYKDARVDMNILDTVCGVENWQREHFTVNGSMYCRVSIYNEKTGQWVSKEDVGSESYTEKEKGLASDAFKRACFNWGIGRELYDYPEIKIKLKNNEFSIHADKVKQTYELKLKEWVWVSQFINGKINYLGCKDQKGETRFQWGKYSEKKERKEIQDTDTDAVLAWAKKFDKDIKGVEKHYILSPVQKALIIKGLKKQTA